MQNQPRPRPLSNFQFRFDQHRRATLFGGIIALLGLALLLWPHEHRTAASEGDDIATLAKLVNLPAVPLATHWRVEPMGAADSARAPGPNDWRLARSPFRPRMQRASAGRKASINRRCSPAS
ncbi:MAG TPA: hypothetical protein VGJ31_11520 [Dongiaceae bacterium]